jgi:(p)ppGpp synthase/HD superfamily hydrolase
METKNIIKARAVAKIAHFSQRYSGRDYFEAHVSEVARRVSEAGGSERHIVVAYLHDVIEDTHVTLSDLHDLGFSSVIQAAVDALTRREGETYLTEYIERVLCNDIATVVKYHDLRANTNTATPVKLARRNLKAMTRIKAEMSK